MLSNNNVSLSCQRTTQKRQKGNVWLLLMLYLSESRSLNVQLWKIWTLISHIWVNDNCLSQALSFAGGCNWSTFEMSGQMEMRASCNWLHLAKIISRSEALDILADIAGTKIEFYLQYRSTYWMDDLLFYVSDKLTVFHFFSIIKENESLVEVKLT